MTVFVCACFSSTNYLKISVYFLSDYFPDGNGSYRVLINATLGTVMLVKQILQQNNITYTSHFIKGTISKHSFPIKVDLTKAYNFEWN